MTKTSLHCDYCGLSYSGTGYSPDGNAHFCCYGCYLVQGIVSARGEEAVASWILVRLGIGAFFAMNVMMISLILYVESEAALGISVVRALHWALVILSTPAVVILGLPLATAALRSLRSGRLNMDALIIVSSVIAYGISTYNVVLGKGHIYFDTATMLLLIITLGRLLEASVKSRTSGTIRNLMDLVPQNANVLRNGCEIQVPIAEVEAGEVIRVRPGERIAVDGKILEGSCMVEESAFTGESRPRNCKPGDSVFGGSVDCDGVICVKATAVGEDSMLAQVRRMIRDAQDNRAPVERLAERAASAFIPVIWLVAACAGLYWWLVQGNPERAGMSALAVVVVACPCSLGLATPVAICLAVGIAAKKGVLIRSGEVLERLPQLRKVFFDKTGTLTYNNLRLSEIRTASEVMQDEALSWAASAETGSEHSIAKAIVDALHEKGLPLGTAKDTQIYPGEGLSARILLNGQEKLVSVGSWNFVTRSNTAVNLQPSINEIYTTVYTAWDSEIRAEFIISDSLRPDAASTVQTLQSMGISVAVISGDQEGPVKRTANEAGIDDYITGCSIQDKAEAIKTASGGVGMIGDGINDAPALAEADVGFAVHGGTDLAKEAGSVVLLGDDLTRIPWSISLAQRTYCIIRQNLYWAFGYNLVAVVLAFMGYVHPLIAASAMFLSSLAVLSNSLRLTKMDISPDSGNAPASQTVYTGDGYNSQP